MYPPPFTTHRNEISEERSIVYNHFDLTQRNSRLHATKQKIFELLLGKLSISPNQLPTIQLSHVFSLSHIYHILQ